VASNVTVDVEFNPAEVNDYRVIGYDTGLTQTGPLKDRIKTGWNMSAGQSVTILYEIVPSTKGVTGSLTVRVGYLEASNKSEKSLAFPFVDDGKTFAASSTDFRFAAAVASFGMLLSESPYKGTATIDSVRVIAENSLGPDRDGSRREFLELIRRAGQIRQQKN
jgi:Ca-activated chloride channel family protein